jgi:hypothetical protein
MPASFVPAEFVVPTLLETPQFRLRPLTINDLVKDYDAVMSSIDHLQGIFNEEPVWPTSELTLEQDLIDLGWHQKEFQIRSSFTFTVMSLDENQCLGCVYMYPSEVDGYDAAIFMWVRASEYAKGLHPVLEETVKTWVSDAWPFTNARYPDHRATGASSRA